MRNKTLRKFSFGFCFAACAFLFMLTAFVAMPKVNVEAAETYVYGDWTYTLGDKGCTIVSYNGSDRVVEIPTSIDGYKVGEIGRQAFYNNRTLQTVTIPETITYIGPEAFRNCVGLSQIYFNAKNCSVPDIWRYDDARGVGVFSGAGSAAVSLNVKFGNKVTRIPNGLFNTDIENGFAIANVTSITFSDAVKTIGAYAFADCRVLGPVSIGNNVTTIEQGAFAECQAMTKVKFKDALQSIGKDAFFDCKALEEIIWGEGLDSIGEQAFKLCSSLKEANIPAPTTTIGRQAFADDISLEKVTIPSSVTSINAEAFRNTIKLSKINFNAKNCTVPTIWRHDDARGVGVFSGAGSGVTELKVVFGSLVPKVPDNLFNTDRENGYEICYVTDVTFHKNVKEVGAGAFEGCESLENLVLGAGITKLNDYAFLRCSGLTKVTFNDKLASIGAYAFQECSNLEKIVWGDGLDSIGNDAFRECTSLKEANIPVPTTTLGSRVFYNCTSLEKVTIPTSMTSMSAEVFFNTTKLSKIYYNAINCIVPTIWQYDSARGVGVFSGAGSGTSSLAVTIGSKVKSIPESLFDTDKENGFDHAYITTVSIPGSVETIGHNAFADCQRLTTVTSKTNNVTIGNTIFKGTPENLKVKCYYGSDMHTYGKNNSLNYVYLKPVQPKVSKVSNTSSGVKVEWKKAIGAYKYYVYRKSSSTGSWKLLEIVTTNKRSYVDDEASAGKTYYYTVKAYSPNKYASAYNKTGLKIERLKAPTGLKLSKVSTGIKLQWNKATGAKTYLVYRAKGSGSYKKLVSVSTNYYTDKSVVKGNTYKYRVFACDGSYKSVACTAVKIKK